MKVMVCGSIALDLIGRYQGSFDDYQASYPVKALNISLQLADLRTSFGGCGINIAYGLQRHGVNVIPLTAAGSNFNDQYRAHLEAIGMDLRHIIVDPAYASCATAVMITDDHGNQITVFHAGAAVSNLRPLPSELPDINEVGLAILAPEDAPIMLRQARDLARLGIPMMFDPGQGLAAFSRDDARELISLAHYVIVNQHEWEILQQIAGMNRDEILACAREVIVTHGKGGVEIFRAGAADVRVPAVTRVSPRDPTGCGDAFRAGYVYGLLRGEPVETCARLGCLTAAYNLECDHTQLYAFSREEFASRYAANYEEPIAVSSGGQ